MVSSSSSSLAARVAGFTLIFVLAGCTSDPPDTAVVLQMDSDYVVPDEVNVIGFESTEANGSPGGGFGSIVGAPPEGAKGQPGRCRAPYLPMLAMHTRDPGDRVTFDFYVERVEEGGDPRTRLVEQQLVVEMVEGRWLLVPVRLDRACENIECPAGQTCRVGACASTELDPATLEEFDRARADEIICD